MRFVIGSGKMQEIAKHNAEKIGFWLCPRILPGDAKQFPGCRFYP
jgi:hypothetical protein